MNTALQIKKMVWFKGNNELHGYVTGILEEPGGWKYRVGWMDGSEGWHYDFEITTAKPLDY